MPFAYTGGMLPAIDIVLPLRNAEATLPACLDSIAAQTYRGARLIMVDDGSIDDSRVIAEAHAARHGHALILDNHGRGIVDALNAGIAASTAPLIARMDADDIMLPERLARQAALLDARPDIGVAACRVEEHGYEAGFAHYLAWSNRLTEPEAIARARFIESPLVHPTVMFRREVVARHGGYADGDFPEDYELWLRWMEADVRFAKTEETLMRWSDRDDRLTRTDPRYAPEAFFSVKARYIARWLTQHSPHGPRAWIWGGGPVTRRRVRGLTDHGITIEGFIDIDPRKIGTMTRDGIISGEAALPGPERSFVLAAVGSRGARALIAEHLAALGYAEGRTFLSIA